jgi:hypothetical protein
MPWRDFAKIRGRGQENKHLNIIGSEVFPEIITAPHKFSRSSQVRRIYKTPSALNAYVKEG